MGHKGFERRRRVDAWLPSAAELLRRRPQYAFREMRSHP